ncbi:MAG: sigma-54-dependent Fis family transcriptional regulator [Fibrobacter sp.]|nr:sigma-54-dependent Fis family transcriptional regulator [Fibrobacter sp.]
MSLLLIAEDNQALRENMKWALVSEYNVIEADTADDCVNLFKMKKPDLVCLDMGLDNEPLKGLEIIDTLLTIDRNAKIIVITANTSSTVGPESVRKGAFDFFNKPVDIDQLKIVIKRALKRSELEKQLPDSTDTAGVVQSDATLSMIGESAAMKQVFEIIRKLSQTDMNVLICGESGTGKELCARAIHYHSARKMKNFVPINCGAIPENLIESELFGYVKGAFTGANSDKEGLIESANGGTLLLDEIGEMPKNLQVKLLRFLEDQNVQRVGDTVLRKVNVRVIAATNRKNLDSGDSEMRSDLYYRLSEFQIDLPPLRQRGEDILIIARALVAKNREKFGSARLQLSPRAESALLNYSWPGNVRELENKLSRASIICQNQTIEPDDLQLASVSSFSNMNFKDARNAFEKEYLTNLLKRFDYNISDAARAAEISRPTLYDMMKKLGLQIHTESHIKQ